MEQIGFGGGCHWCTEAVFQSLKGMEKVEQGWICSQPPHDKYSEAVQITYDPSAISLDILIEIHLRTHASMSEHKLRGKYRSAIYVFEDDQASVSRKILKEIQSEFDAPLVTQVLFHRGFKASDTRFENYYLQDPERPFCKTYIDPKLQLLRKRFSENCLSV